MIWITDIRTQLEEHLKKGNDWEKLVTPVPGVTVVKVPSTSGAIEKKVDINISIDIISLAYEDAYDTAVLASSAGDFIPVVKKVKELGKIVEVWAFKYSLAYALKEELDQENIYYLDDILSKIKM